MRRTLRPLARELARAHPDLQDPELLIRAGGVLVNIDVSYLALADAAPQLGRLDLLPDAELIALVKAQFELGLGEPPRARALLDAAVTRARAGFEACGWQIVDSMPSPVCGTRG